MMLISLPELVLLATSAQVSVLPRARGIIVSVFRLRLSASTLALGER